MTRKWCGPPIQAEDQRAGVLLRFGNLDYPDNIEKAFRAQSERRAWPRLRACATREPGPGELAARAALEQERKKPPLQYTRPPGPGDLAALNAEWAATATGYILAVLDGGRQP